MTKQNNTQNNSFEGTKFNFVHIHARRQKPKRFVVYYLGSPENEEEEGWAYVERTRRFTTIKRALEKSKELMKKNKKIVQASIERIVPPKTVIVQENDMAVVLWNEQHVFEEGEDGIVTEYQSDEYEFEAKN